MLLILIILKMLLIQIRMEILLLISGLEMAVTGDIQTKTANWTMAGSLIQMETGTC